MEHSGAQKWCTGDGRHHITLALFSRSHVCCSNNRDLVNESFLMVCACSLKAEVKVKRGGLWVSDICTYCKTVPDGRLWENCISEQTLRMPMPLIRVALMRIMFCNIKIMV